MPSVIALILLALILIPTTSQAIDVVRTESIAKRMVTSYLKSLVEDDFEEFIKYHRAYYSRGIPILLRLPKVMRENKIAELRELAAQKFFADNSTLRQLLQLKPKLTVLEVNKVRRGDPTRDGYQMYVRLEYANPESSPTIQDNVSYSSRSKRSFSRLKSIILSITITFRDGRTWNIKIVPDSRSYWPQKPLTIMSVEWKNEVRGRGGKKFIFVEIDIMGGTEPYKLSVFKCWKISTDGALSGLIINSVQYFSQNERVREIGSATTIDRGFLAVTAAIAPDRYPLRCFVEAKDSLGTIRTRTFDIPFQKRYSSGFKKVIITGPQSILKYRRSITGESLPRYSIDGKFLRETKK